MPSSTTPEGFATIHDAVAAIGRGEIVVVVDDEDRENEGDLIMAAEFGHAGEDRVLRAAHLRRTSARRSPASALDELDIAAHGRATTPRAQRTAFTVSRRLPPRHHRPASRPSTGPPPSRRSIDPATRPDDLARPGHIFPLRCARRRRAQARRPHRGRPSTWPAWPGLYPAGVLCEIVNDDGTDMARVPELSEFADEHDLLHDLDRRAHPLPPPEREAGPPAWPRPASRPTGASSPATCTSRCSTASSTSRSCKGAVQGEDDVLVRVHSECLTGDVFGSLRCDCGIAARRRPCAQIADEGLGVVVYLRGHEGRGIGIGHKIRAYNLQDAGPRHRRRQPRARPARRQPRVRHRRADPRRPGHHHHAAADQQPGQVRRPRGLRPRDHRARAARDRAEPREPRATCAPSASAWATSSTASTSSDLGSTFWARRKSAGPAFGIRAGRGVRLRSAPPRPSTRRRRLAGDRRRLEFGRLRSGPRHQAHGPLLDEVPRREAERHRQHGALGERQPRVEVHPARPTPGSAG